VWGVDVPDCLAAALLVMRGLDKRRLAICGASYGSYLVTRLLAFDPLHRFACGVARCGDCNLLTSWADCDRSGLEDLYRMMGHPSTHRDGYKAGSPVWQVENIQAPLLILHGLLDPYVPPRQSEELVEALRKAGKTYEYKTYPDEGHGFARRANQLDFYERMERFIDCICPSRIRPEGFRRLQSEPLKQAISA
jgi:dipeptidyl aminopeptidase/acylaminoacyl peptidase